MSMKCVRLGSEITGRTGLKFAATSFTTEVTGDTQRKPPTPDARLRSVLSFWEGENEGAAASEFAYGADAALVGQDDVLGDGQAEACAAGLAGASFIDPIETLEKTRQMFGWDAGAEVTNIELNSLLCLLRAKIDAPAGTSVFHRVVNQVGEYLVNRLAVGENLRKRV